MQTPAMDASFAPSLPSQPDLMQFTLDFVHFTVQFPKLIAWVHFYFPSSRNA